jgi:hypothetical protein
MDAELATQRAADIPDVSRPTLARSPEDGAMSLRTIGDVHLGLQTSGMASGCIGRDVCR